MRKVTWLIEPDPAFPGPEQLLASGEIEAVLIEPSRARPWEQRWPEAEPPFVAYGTMHTMLVVLSEVVDMGQEYRCFCRDGRVFCHSSYPAEPYAPAPPDVLAFAERVAARLAGHIPSGMLCVDVGKSHAALRLVEVGGVNSWGVYGADVRAFAAAMEAEAREVHEERAQGGSGVEGGVGHGAGGRA